MSRWFGKNSKEVPETVDKEVYDKAVSENKRLKGDVDKLMLDNKENDAKLEEAQKKLNELLIKTEEESVILGLLSTDKTREKDKYIEVLIGDVKEILVLEQELRRLEEKSIKLRERQSKPDTTKKAEIKDQMKLIKLIEGEYLISSIETDLRASMTGKEEEEKKKEAFEKQLKNATNNLSIVENLKKAAYDYENPTQEKATPPKQSSHNEGKKAEKNVKENTSSKVEERVKKEKSNTEGWDEEVEIQ